jgi:arabinose-5-phosphate isomerase
LASTGTPASFVHATEASHGDLGMLTTADFCLLISNSGETSELRDIVAHTRRFGIPMAAISSKVGSTLIQASDYKLILPTAPEACSIGMAPTTSTTLTLALGDALAVALMERRDFQPEDFKVFHPGGKLGAQMSTVGQLMRLTSEMAIVEVEVPIREIILKMTETGYGLAVLVDKEGAVQGVITDGDLRRQSENLFDQDTLALASRNPITVSPSDFIGSAINKMEINKVYSILVIENKKPVGLLRMHDLLRAGVA